MQPGSGAEANGNPKAHPANSGSHLLTADEVTQYQRDGYIVPNFRLPADEVARLRGLILKLVEDNRDIANFLMRNPHIPGQVIAFGPGKGDRELKTPPGWMEFAAHPKILDIIEQISGPDLILRGTAAFYKRPQKGPATAFHRDAQGQVIKPLQSTHVWIAVTDTRVENACLRFVPGSHKARVSGRHTNNDVNPDGTVGPQLVAGEFDETRAVDVEVEAGGMIIHDVFTIHGSRPNTGTSERASFALRFMPATSLYDHAATPKEIDGKGNGLSKRPLILVRGADRAGNDFEIGHPKTK